MNDRFGPKRSDLPDSARPYIGRGSHYIVRDLCAVLQEQMNALAEEGPNLFSERKLKAYQMRHEKIVELRKELADFSSSFRR